MQELSNSVPEIISGTIVEPMKWHERMNAQLTTRNWSIPELASRMGKPNDENLIEKLYKYAAGKVDNPRGTVMQDIAAAFGISETALRTGSNTSHEVLNSGTASDLPHNAIIAGAVGGFVKIPIRGQGMGGKDGALIFSGNEHVGDVTAPHALATVPNAYAVYVVGDSMLERYKSGEIVFVNPHQPVRRGDDCVIQVQTRGDERHGWVKRFLSRDEQFVRVEQLNPKKIMKFPARTVISVHKIIMGGPA